MCVLALVCDEGSGDQVGVNGGVRVEGGRTPTTIRTAFRLRASGGKSGELISDDYRSRPQPPPLGPQHTLSYQNPLLTSISTDALYTTNGVRKLAINTVKPYRPPSLAP